MKAFALDTETRGLEWFESDQGPFLTTWSDPQGNDHLAHIDDARAMDAFKSDMCRSDLIVAHNLPFDAHQLREHANFDILTLGKKLVDTDILARVVVPERRTKGDDENDRGKHGFKLKDLGTTYVDQNAKDTENAMAELAKQAGIKLKAKGGYYDTWRAFPEAMEAYAKNDTRLTIDLLPKLQRKLTSNLALSWETERDVQPHLIRAEARGVTVDQAKVAPLKVAYTEKRNRAYAAVSKVLGEEAIKDPEDSDSKDNHDALRDALLSHGVPLYRKVASCKHDGGCDCALATNKFALQEFKDAYPVIQDLFDLRQASKFLSTYIDPMDGREVVHPTYWQIGAWTSRMSCSRPNMQNIPVRGDGAAELRAMFVPRPGHVFVISDFDAIEARLLAYYLGRRGEPYRAMIENGHDVHAWMASQIWGGEPSTYAKGGPNDKKRSLAKNVLFAIVYGAGGGRVADMLADAGMPCQIPHYQWNPAHPKTYCKCEGCLLAKAIKNAVPGYHNLAGRRGRIRQKVEEVGHVNTIIGQRLPVNPDKAYVGLNAIIQGSAAGIFKRAVINVSEAVAHLGAQPVLFVHDEIGTECPIEHAKECQRLQDEAMMAAWDLNPRLLVSSSIAHHDYSEGK